MLRQVRNTEFCNILHCARASCAPTCPTSDGAVARHVCKQTAWSSTILQTLNFGTLRQQFVHSPMSACLLECVQAEVDAMVGEVKAAVTAVEVDTMPAIKAKQVSTVSQHPTRGSATVSGMHTQSQHTLNATVHDTEASVHTQPLLQAYCTKRMHCSASSYHSMMQAPLWHTQHVLQAYYTRTGTACRIV
jgi:hypothetical protein